MVGVLKEHECTHNGERLFTRNLCKKFFKQHFASKVNQCTHTEEWLFTCGVCKKCFSQLSAFKRQLCLYTVNCAM
jgi:hypothetical protein